MDRDFTIIWGGNLSKKIYRSNAVRFSRGEVNWEGDVVPDMNELAWVSLIPKDKSIWAKIKSVAVGDQVEIKGRLVNISADRTASSGHVEYNSGIPGKDRAYSVIYVDELKTLRKASPFYNYLFWLSLLELAALAVYRLTVPLRRY